VGVRAFGRTARSFDVETRELRTLSNQLQQLLDQAVILTGVLKAGLQTRTRLSGHSNDEGIDHREEFLNSLIEPSVR
jgi:hypothetical protein